MIAWLRLHLSRRWLLMLLALFILGEWGDITLAALNQPGDRLTVSISAASVHVKNVPPGSPLQRGDIIISVDGIPIDTPRLLQRGFWLRHNQTRRKTQASAPIVVPYEIIRRGERQIIQVAWEPYTLPLWLRRVGGLYVSAFVFLATAFLVIWEERREFGSRMMALFLLSIAFIEVNNLIPATSLTLLLNWGWFFIPADIAAVMLTTLVTPYAFLVFPRTVPWLRKYHASVILAALTVIIGPTWFIISFHPGTVLQIREAIFTYLNPLILMALLFSLGRIIYQAFRAIDPLERAQWRGMAFGAAVAVLPYLLFHLIPLVFRHNPSLPLTVTNAATMFFPLATLVAIFRYRLIEIDRAIQGFLTWLLLVMIAALLYIPVARILKPLWLWMMIARGNAEFATVVIVTSLALLLAPAVRNAVDRLLAREWYNFNQAMEEISERLTRVVDEGELHAILERELPDRLGLYGARLLPHRPDRGDFGDPDAGLALADDAPIVRWLERQGTLLSVYHLAGLPGEAREEALRLAEAKIEVAIPIFLDERLVSIYLMMTRRSANLFTRRELEALGLLGHQLSTIMRNVELYQQLQNYNRMLEAKVEKRTRELAAERNRLNAILQNIADGLIVTDLDGRITMANPAFLRLIGHEETTVLGEELAELLPTETLQRLQREALHRPNEIVALTVRMREKVFKASALALRQENHVVGTVILLHDITREEELDRMKTEFISTVSHELRTPLTAILGFAKLVLRTLERQIEPLIDESHHRERRALQRAEENLRIIIDEGGRLTSLINDLLDIARLEAGRMQWHMGSVDIHQVVQQAVSAVESLAEEKALPIWVRSDESLPPLHADAQRLRQVFINLLSNAIKFTDTGQITIRMAKVEVDAEGTITGCPLGPHHPELPPGSWLAICVEDTGVGIAEEELELIFDRFRQAGNVLTDRPQGAGLGLAISREIVLAHGGYIWAESQPGEGSTFFVLLPLERGEEREAEASS